MYRTAILELNTDTRSNVVYPESVSGGQRRCPGFKGDQEDLFGVHLVRERVEFILLLPPIGGGPDDNATRSTRCVMKLMMQSPS